MALELPYVHVRLTDDRPKVDSLTRPAPLDPPDLAALLQLDARTRPRHPPGDRALPLADGQWAVGRGGFGGVTWRILDPDQVRALAHPAWLWRSSRWFDPTAPARGPVPNPLPLRAQLDPAARLGGSPSRTAALLASTVAVLRRNTGPAALVIDPASVADPAPSGRWFLLALLTLLPPALRGRLRVSTFEHDPDPDHWDVVVVSRPVEGFQCLRPESHPPLGGDLVATFVLERLLDDDPETVEQAATWSEGDGPDGWAEAIRQRRPPSHTATPAFSHRRAGSTAGARGSTTPSRIRLNTPEAWLSLSTRSEEDRARIVLAWLERDDLEPPTEDVLDAVASIRPTGRDTLSWCAALLRWSEAGPSRGVATRLLGEAIDQEPLPLEPSTRASLWTEYVRLLLQQGEFDEVLGTLSGTSAHALATAGAGRTLSEAWLRLPSSRRPVGALDALVDLLLDSPEGDECVSHLWQALMVQERDARADHVLHRIVRRAITTPNLPIQALIDVLADSPQAMRWVGHVGRTAPPDQLWALVAPVTRGPDDPLWEHCVDVRSQHAAPEDRIADLVGLPQPQVARLERELRTAASTVRVWRFPDMAVAEGAARLADLADRSPLWLWLHACAAPPQHTAEGLLAAIVDAFCERPPPSSDERTAAMAMAEALGAAEGWTALQHAELLLRLALAPDDGTRFADDLSAAMARGLARRARAGEHMAGITDELGALPPDHPALRAFLQRLLPLAFARGVPQGYLAAVHSSRWPSPTRDAWRRIVDSLGVA